MENKIQDLYKSSIELNNLLWVKNVSKYNVDLETIEKDLSCKFNDKLRNFINDHPDNNISKFNKNIILPKNLEEKKIDINNILYNNYTKLKSNKTEVNEEYYIALENSIAITKECNYYNNVNHINDNLCGSDTILKIIAQLANFSYSFNNTKPIEDKKYNNSTNVVYDYLNKFDDLIYFKSDNSSSFMQPMNKDLSAIHIRKQQRDNFTEASSIFHEVGHHIYQINHLNKNTEIGKFGQYLSITLHETSSILNEIVNSGLNPIIDRYSNNRLIRLGSNKLDYIIHIYIRVLIENMLFVENMNVREIRDVWNELTKKYFNMTPTNDFEGFLQDIHWNRGMFGYFHSYALGFFNACVLQDNIKNDITEDYFNNTLLVNDIIDKTYGKFTENTEDMLNILHPNIHDSLEKYKNFINNNFYIK